MLNYNLILIYNKNSVYCSSDVIQHWYREKNQFFKVEKWCRIFVQLNNGNLMCANFLILCSCCVILETKGPKCLYGQKPKASLSQNSLCFSLVFVLHESHEFLGSFFVSFLFCVSWKQQSGVRVNTETAFSFLLPHVDEREVLKSRVVLLGKKCIQMFIRSYCDASAVRVKQIRWKTSKSYCLFSAKKPLCFRV